jgi:hypothetical protein
MNDSKRIRILSATLIFCIAAPLAAFAGGSTFQASNVHTYVGDNVVAGAGTLLRSKKAVELRFEMAGLDMNAAYTLWWIIFNKPEKCKYGTFPALCGEDDIGGPADTGVRNAAAFITGYDGTANIVGKLNKGKFPAGGAGFGQLNHAQRAEIHIVVQTHGTPLIGYVADQMTIPGAACNDTCADQYTIVFLPVKQGDDDD